MQLLEQRNDISGLTKRNRIMQESPQNKRRTFLKVENPQHYDAVDKQDYLMHDFKESVSSSALCLSSLVDGLVPRSPLSKQVFPNLEKVHSSLKYGTDGDEGVKNFETNLNEYPQIGYATTSKASPPICEDTNRNRNNRRNYSSCVTC